jgi:hypothetical protein
MSKTEQALVLNAEALNKLVDIITQVLEAKEVSDVEAAEARAKATELIAKDEFNAEVVSSATAKLEELITLAAAAVPAEEFVG